MAIRNEPLELRNSVFKCDINSSETIARAFGAVAKA
jgi:hypothetical protein